MLWIATPDRKLPMEIIHSRFPWVETCGQIQLTSNMFVIHPYCALEMECAGVHLKFLVFVMTTHGLGHTAIFVSFN